MLSIFISLSHHMKVLQWRWDVHCHWKGKGWCWCKWKQGGMVAMDMDASCLRLAAAAAPIGTTACPGPPVGFVGIHESFGVEEVGVHQTGEQHA